MLTSKIISARFFAIVDRQTTFSTPDSVGSRKIWKLGVGVGHFISDSSTLVPMNDLSKTETIYFVFRTRYCSLFTDYNFEFLWGPVWNVLS